jgi:hypothetical protein
MQNNAISFDRMERQSPQRGMRCKIFRDGSKQLRLVEFSSDFVETQWCEKPHAGFVLSRGLEISFADQVIRYPEGSALLIPAGVSHAHKARATTPVACLFLVEEVTQP